MGIDPGNKTGIAVVDKGKIVFINQYVKKDAYDVCTTIAKDYKVATVAIEQPRLGVLYARMGVFSKGGQIKQAQNIGQNIEFTNWLMAKFKEEGFFVLAIAPERKRKRSLGSTKWDTDVWCRVFNWGSGRVPGEHARDAAIIAYLNEGRHRHVSI